MKKQLKLSLALVFLFVSVNLNAQTPTNATVYDCNNTSKNIQNTLGTGKALVILSKGFDCSICVNAAPAWQTFAAQNTSSVEVWGAMTFTYSGSIPTCSNINTWRNSHNWFDIYMFIDSTEQWYLRGTPRYLVYSAIDSTIVYDGRNPTTARNVALSNTLITSIKKYDAIGDIKVKSFLGRIELSDLPSDLRLIEVINLSGQLIKTINVNANQININLSDSSGIYLLKFTNSKNQVGIKKIHSFK